MKRITDINYKLLLVVFLFSKNANSQGSLPAKTTIPRIDIIAGSKASSNLPFDSAFTMGIHYDKPKKIYAVDLVTLARDRSLFNAYNHLQRVNHLIASYDKDTTTTVLNVEFRYAGKYHSGILKPARQYALVITTGLVDNIFEIDERNKTIFSEFFDAIDSNGTVNNAKLIIAYSDYDQIRNDQIQILGTRMTTLLDSSLAFDDYKKNIYAQHKKAIDLQKAVENDSDIDTIIKFGDMSDAKRCIKLAMTFFDIGNHFKIKDGCLRCDSICKIITTLESITETDESAFKDLNNGYYVIGDNLNNPILIKKAKIFQDRIKNITSSVSKLIDIKNILDRLAFEGNTNTFIVCLQELINKEIKALIQKDKDLNEVYKIRKNIVDGMQSGARILYSGIEVLNVDSYIMNFQTRTALHITPIFGYTVYGFQNGFTDFSPYLGFQINLEPMNINVPFNQIRNKTLLQRFAFFTGWTLRSVSYPGKRQDFFGNSSSLITGFGFKFNHALMLNAGTLWFKQLNPNPYLADKKIAATFCLSISVNLTVKDFLNGFTSLIPSL